MSGLAVLLVFLGLLIVGALAIIGIYNALVSKRIRASEAYSQIDVQLKRRYDLIPNLVETVKGYAAHERNTLEQVVQARNAAIAVPAGNIAQQAQAENVLTGTLRQLFALSESYPNLKANENFKQLQEELASTENRIAFARQYYNDSVATYNTATQTFPSNLMANAFNFKPMDFFKTEEAAERVAPQVKF
jgi:LemA protein